MSAGVSGGGGCGEDDGHGRTDEGHRNNRFSKMCLRGIKCCSEGISASGLSSTSRKSRVRPCARANWPCPWTGAVKIHLNRRPDFYGLAMGIPELTRHKIYGLCDQKARICRSKGRSSLLRRGTLQTRSIDETAWRPPFEFGTITTAPNGLTWVASLAKAYIQPFHPGPSSEPPSLLRLGHLRVTT